MSFDLMGYIFVYEYLYIDFFGFKNNVDCCFDQYVFICQEMNDLMIWGVCNVIEMINCYMGCNV